MYDSFTNTSRRFVSKNLKVSIILIGTSLEATTFRSILFRFFYSLHIIEPNKFSSDEWQGNRLCDRKHVFISCRHSVFRTSLNRLSLFTACLVVVKKDMKLLSFQWFSALNEESYIFFYHKPSSQTNIEVEAIIVRSEKPNCPNNFSSTDFYL